MTTCGNGPTMVVNGLPIIFILVIK
jgi:hypothetical protein